MATTYMREVSAQTFREKLLCCAALNAATAAGDSGGPFATPENLEFFSVAAVRAALVECYPDIVDQKLAVAILGDLSGTDGEPEPEMDPRGE